MLKPNRGNCRAEAIRIREGRGILVISPQGLGDVVASSPLLKAICHWAKGRWPVRGLFASRESFEVLREEGLGLIPFFVRPTYEGGRGLGRLWLDLRETTDLIVTVPEVSSAKLVLLKLVLGARYAAGEAVPPYARFVTFPVTASWTKPILETQREIAAALGIEAPLDPPSLRVTLDEQQWAEFELHRVGLAGNQPLLGMHCSSVVPSKRWPAEHYGAALLAQRNKFPNVGVISFGIRAERHDAEKAREIAGDFAWFEGTGAWSVRETLAMLSQCDLLISGDTGLMHMAAAVGTRTLSIFGPTSPGRRAPAHNGGAALCPAKPCHPCYRGVWKPCQCIRSISPEDAAAAAETLLVKSSLAITASQGS